MSKFTLATFVATLLLNPVFAASIRVIDGDTVEISGETIRIYNIDAPEIRHAQCEAERRLALVAKRRLSDLLDQGHIEIVRGDKGRMKDRYSRTLAVIRIDGQDVGNRLVNDGLARPWTGKRQPWCD